MVKYAWNDSLSCENTGDIYQNVVKYKQPLHSDISVTVSMQCDSNCFFNVLQKRSYKITYTTACNYQFTFSLDVK